jgi:3-isopropylmalate dehydratase small subunit
MKTDIGGHVHLLGDDINTDINCSSKYMPGRDNSYIAQHAFEQVAPGFASGLKVGDIIVAGRNFGINSVREQAVHVIRMLGVAAIVARSFGRQFYRNAINNGLPVVECDIGGIAEGDEIAVDLASGLVTLPQGVVRHAKPLPREILAMLSDGGLIPFLQQHPNWNRA